jgi:hypothetical protein
MNPKEKEEKAKWREEMYRQIRAELDKNEWLAAYLEKGYPGSREHNKSDYARQKVRWLEWGEKFKQWNEDSALRWVIEATNRLAEIQQKKLFDVQCQWRAEKIMIEEVKVSHDFFHWESNIFNCPFITPVSEDEVELYLQYLQSSNFERYQGWLDRWQDYKAIKKAYQSDNANRNFPDWYDFHNGRTGMGAMMMLADLRGEKEEFYLDLWRSERHQNMQAANAEYQMIQTLTANTGVAVQPEHDPRPWLKTHEKGWLTWFVNTFEDKQTQEIFTRYGGERSHSSFDQHLDQDLLILRDADRPVPVQAWFDWKEAIHRATEKYVVQRIIEAMPLAYEQYRIKIETGIAFDQKHKADDDDFDWYRNAILRGRELNGEPRNFEF